MLIIKYEHKNNINFCDLKYHIYFYRVWIYNVFVLLTKYSNTYCYNKQLCAYIIYYDMRELLTLLNIIKHMSENNDIV